FVDYKCPYCAAWTNNNLPKLKKDYIDTGKVQLYIVNFPFLGPDSIKAAMVGEILWKQNHEAFWEYTEALYAHQGEEK
ncbi:thioredoxin domain-containing protein, partial [Klebsiella pneumoniae]